jgi:PAS domain-containing protein
VDDEQQSPKGLAPEVSRLGSALRSRQWVSAELIKYAKDGRRYWVGMKIEPLLDANGDFEGFMAIQADITDRFEERQAMEESTRRFNMALPAARVGVLERAANFEVLWWNKDMWEIFGQDPVNFKPTNARWLALIHPDAPAQTIRPRVSPL